jgi:undecaprenyl-diphosphatase
MDASPRDAVALALVQGIAYVFPISSDGHAALMDLLFGVREPTLLLSVTFRFSALLATCIVLRARCGRLLRELTLSFAQPSRLWSTQGGRDATAVAFASVPTALFGLFLREPVAAWSRSPLVVGVGLLGTSAWLLSTHWLKPGRDEFPGLLGAMLIGTAQGLAVLPGLSRSAGTIVCALWLGVRPDRAFELSFLSSLPALLGIIVFDGRFLLREPAPIGVVLAAGLVSLVACVAALLLLERVVRSGRLAWFAGYTLPLAFATLAMALVWPH